jgi:ribosomal-protein-alanine N-acetyltransferase
MDSSCALWLAAEQNGEIVGYLGTQLVLDEGEILRIAVAADRRGEKIGTALLREMLALTPQTNIWNLDVRESNAPAQGLYRKFGFDIIGRRKHYYRDPEEDAVLMQRRRD